MESYLLVLNCAEGFLQLIVGEGPAHLKGREPVDGSSSENVPSPVEKSRQRRGVSSPLKCVQEWRLPSQGSELLTPALNDITHRLGIDIAQISHIACVTGPGSFTGIRLTTTTAGGLALATGAVMGGIPYLPLLAGNAATLLQGMIAPAATLWVVTHARRGLVHAQAFQVEGQMSEAGAGKSGLALCREQSDPKGSMEQGETNSLQDQGTTCQAQGKGHDVACQNMAHVAPSFAGASFAIASFSKNATLRPLQTEVLVLELDALVALLAGQRDTAILCGSGITKNKTYLRERLADFSRPPVLLHENFDVPQASVLFDAACGVEYGSAELLPDYVRASDAEEALDSIAVKLGLDAEEAQAAYAALQNQ